MLQGLRCLLGPFPPYQGHMKAVSLLQPDFLLLKLSTWRDIKPNPNTITKRAYTTEQCDKPFVLSTSTYPSADMYMRKVDDTHYILQHFCVLELLLLQAIPRTSVNRLNLDKDSGHGFLSSLLTTCVAIAL